MYGFVLEGVGATIRAKFSEETWNEIIKKAHLHATHFTNDKRYSESAGPRIMKAASEVTGMDANAILEACGSTFYHYITQYGYDRVIKVLGRHLRDFFNCLDNLHEYLRFTYPSIKPPSFLCEDETKDGVTLIYRSKRKGYLPYVIGQIKSIAKEVYNTDLEVEILQEEETRERTIVVMRLKFDNKAFIERKNEELARLELTKDLPITYEMLNIVFPFNVVFNENLIINDAGASLQKLVPYIRGQPIDEVFQLKRPLVSFNEENILHYINNVFELHTTDPVVSTATATMNTAADNEDDEISYKILRLKGQMFQMAQWHAFLFIGTPIMENLETMLRTGMYLNDLSMHDSSRDLVLAGTQQQAEIKLLLDQEQSKSKRLEDSMKKVDEEMKRTDALLYQMIPKQVADKLRHGDQVMNVSQIYESVSILFTDVVSFTTVCSVITPMQVVRMLNAMFTEFDNLTEKHRVFKVETIGDAYMVVSGAPVKTKFHAVYVTDMGFDMIEAIRKVQDPSRPGHSLRIRVGIHTGPVVAGVVGVKMPRYCLIGEAVSIANKMESSGEPMRVHISPSTRDHLKSQPYKIESAYPVKIEGKGDMMTYWVVSKDFGERNSRVNRSTMGSKSSNILTAIMQANIR